MPPAAERRDYHSGRMKPLSSGRENDRDDEAIVRFDFRPHDAHRVQTRCICASMLSMALLVVEDDQLQAQQIEGLIREALRVEVTTVRSERAFRDHVKRMSQPGPLPEAVVLDMMLQWDESTTDPVPAEVTTDGPDEAGLRCIASLRGVAKTVALPVVLYTVVPESAVILRLRELSLDRNVLVCPKTPDDLYLIRALGSVLAARGRQLGAGAPTTHERSERRGAVSFNFYGPSTWTNSAIAAGGEKTTQKATFGERPVLNELDWIESVVERIAADDPGLAQELQTVLDDARDGLDRDGVDPREVEERTKQKLRAILVTAGGTVATSTAARALWELLAGVVG